MGSHKKQDPFYLGGVASMIAATCTQPLDLLKVRLQTNVARGGSRVLSTLAGVVRTEGFLGLYGGLSASLMRQATYSTVRFGAAAEIQDRLSGGGPVTVYQRVGAALLGGVCGGLAGNPTDVVMIRMQNDGKLPPDQRRNYRHVLDGLVRIVRSEGPAALLSGWAPNLTRAAAMTAAQLATYDSAKEFLLRTGYLRDNVVCHFSASMMAGFVASVLVAPVDVVKTRVMNAATGSDGGTSRPSMWHMMRGISRNEGPRGFYKGFLPAYVRLGPHTVVTFMALEQLRRLL